MPLGSTLLTIERTLTRPRSLRDRLHETIQSRIATARNDSVEDQRRPAQKYMPPPDRILEVLRNNDGAMFQQELVEVSGKSAASVSRYLTDLEDEDLVRRVRVNRENLVLIGSHPWDAERQACGDD